MTTTDKSLSIRSKVLLRARGKNSLLKEKKFQSIEWSTYATQMSVESTALPVQFNLELQIN